MRFTRLSLHKKHGAVKALFAFLCVCFGINSHPIYDIDTDVQLLLFRISDPWSNGRHSSPFPTTVHAYVLSRDIQHFLLPSTRFEIAYQCTRYRRFLRRVLHSERVSLVIDIDLMNSKKCDIDYMDTGDADLCTETIRDRSTFSSCIKRCARSNFDLRGPSPTKQDGYIRDRYRSFVHTRGVALQ